MAGHGLDLVRGLDAAHILPREVLVDWGYGVLGLPEGALTYARACDQRRGAGVVGHLVEETHDTRERAGAVDGCIGGGALAPMAKG